MQDIRLRTLIFIALILLLSLIVSKLFSFDVAIIFFVITLIIYLISHIFWINELSKWLDKPKVTEIPDGKGIWQDIFSKIYKNYRFDTKSKKDLATAMEQFVQAADALLDGVVSLNDSNEIIWCNKRAQLMFGIHARKDLNKPIQHIFRNSDIYVIKNIELPKTFEYDYSEVTKSVFSFMLGFIIDHLPFIIMIFLS